MSKAAHLRQRAERTSSSLPPLLADAHQLAATVMLGEHGRRRTGTGEEFWQYRQSGPSDSARSIDWRRSGRSDDTHFVREKEWQAAQTVEFWVDVGQSMQFSSDPNVETKCDRAKLLVLSLAILLVRAGERVGLSGSGLGARTGDAHLARIAEALSLAEGREEYGTPNGRELTARARAAFFSDFMGDIQPIRRALTDAADRGIKGALVQILDQTEEVFPFDGRTRFLSMGGGTEFETQKAGNLRGRYLDRLAAKRAALEDLCRDTGWRFQTHHTHGEPLPALIWLFNTLGAAK